MNDKDFLKILVDKGVIDGGEAKKVLNDAQFSGKKAEEILYEKGIGNETQIAKIKSEILKIPYLKVDPGAVSEDVLKLIPKETSQNYRVIPISRDSSMLVVGMLYPFDTAAQDALRFIAKRERVNLGVYVVTPSDLEAVWRIYQPFKTEIEQAVKEIGSLTPSLNQRIVALEEGVETSKEAPVIKIVASTLKRAVEIKASDVHIEPQRSRLRVRFRIDGELQEVAAMPGSLAQPIVSRVKVLANLKLDETRIPQDGRFRTVIAGKDIDFRVATFPTPQGEKVVIRVLDPSTGLKGLEGLGMSEYNLKILENNLERPYGMVLVTGPTGSGKTTTLYAVLQKLNTDDVNIVSLEDPVEYFLEGANQSQVKPEIGYTFASGLRQILRQDPDIVMVGEIRDSETADLAVNAALTGHIVLSTLHTNNSVGVIPRLVDLGAQPFLLSSALNLMMAQRLVHEICPDCRTKKKAPKDVEEIIVDEIKALPQELREDMEKFSAPYEIYEVQPKSGCKKCGGKGIVGRVALFEIFKMTRELDAIINAGFNEGKLWSEAKRQGIVTLRQDGIIKALDGKVLMEEVLRETV